MCRFGLHNSTGVPSTVQRIRDLKPFSLMNDFMRHPAYIIVVAALTVVCNLLSLDILIYSFYLVLGIYIALFGIDVLPLMPLVIFCYVAPSPLNNPGSGNNEGSVFYPQNGGYIIYSILAIFVICLILRLVFDREIGGKRFLFTKRNLLPGMLLLGFAYLLSGLGMPEYPEIFSKNLLFSVIQFSSVILMYFIFSGAVKWDRTSREYLAWIGMCVGFVVLPQLLENYISGRAFLPGTDIIDRELMYTGWGMHNNIGGMMAMMLPFPFYLASQKKHGWIFTLLASILMLGVLMSCSRTSMIIGSVAYLGLMGLLLIRHPRYRIANLLVFFLVGGTVTGVCYLFFDQLRNVLDLFVKELFLISQRDNLLEYGTKQFLQHPIFGGSFFPQGEYVPWTWITSEMGEFFPPRWHNSIVQVAASCGAIGLAAYGFHRFQTVRLLCRNTSAEKFYIAVYVGILLVLSLFDCHFFNVGPVLFYSMALAFGEKIEESKL